MDRVARTVRAGCSEVTGSCGTHPRPGVTLDAVELEAHAAAHLAAFKRPAYTLLVESLPRGATGKLSKVLLREQDAALTEVAP